ncbi:MAG: Holliday junction branch migration DNA helicase RuvB [Candidatus Aureabacteria bacterium]|nr:Holliday junction branch migration DNA helicase RuvB [Candidatus Auribacterota bacterium]
MPVSPDKRFLRDALKERDVAFEQQIRPRVLPEFVGQEKVKERLSIAIEAAKSRREPLEHALFFGPPGLGKTTLAYIIGNEMGVNVKSASGPAIVRAGDLAGLLTNLKDGDILFIDEIHRLSSAVEEYLYPAMEDFVIDIMIDQGPNARSVRLNLSRFTLVGATTRFGLLTAPLRSRFGLVNRVDFYAPSELAQIVLRSAKILGAEVSAPVAEEISGRSRGTPRIANSLLRRVRDYALVRAGGKITLEAVRAALNLLEIDEEGLDEMDKRILTVIISHYGGGPVGLETIAVAIGEESDTIAEVYEPFLIQKGYLKRTRTGRCATKRAYDHLGIKAPASGQGELGIVE